MFGLFLVWSVRCCQVVIYALPSSLWTLGSKGVKHILAPELDDDDETDPIMALAWDPLSTEYLLIANRYSGVRLVDITTRSVITSFLPPSTAAQVQTLSWVHNAPGMFVTGGKGSLMYDLMMIKCHTETVFV